MLKLRWLLHQRRSLASSTMGLSEVADVDIDDSGKFKYILINAQSSNDRKSLVRGYARCGFHADIFEETEKSTPSDVKLNCVGGGRILHDPSAKTIKVYGYSQGFGQADHKKSVELLRKAYPNYEITYSNEGY